MSEIENKMKRLKNRLIKIHGKIQDTVEDFQDQVHSRIEKSKLAHIVSNLSEERHSCDDNSTDGDKVSICSTESGQNKKDRKPNGLIPSVVINEPENEVIPDHREICKDFLRSESYGTMYRSMSDSDLTYDNGSSNYNSSSESCLSCLSSSDERNVDIRPRAGSLPPEQKLDVPASVNTCTEIIEKIGNRFPRLKSKGERIHRVLRFEDMRFWW